MIALDLQPVAAGADGPRQEKEGEKKKKISPAHSLALQTGPDSGQERRSKAFTCLPSSGLGKACTEVLPRSAKPRQVAGLEANLSDSAKTGLFGHRFSPLVLCNGVKAGRVDQDLAKHPADETPALEITRLGTRQPPSGARCLYLRGRCLKIHPRTAKVATHHTSKDAACITSASPVRRRG